MHDKILFYCKQFVQHNYCIFFMVFFVLRKFIILPVIQCIHFIWLQWVLISKYLHCWIILVNYVFFFLTNAVDSLIFSGNQYICCFEGYNFLFKQVNNHISSTTIKTGNCISNFHSEDLFYQHVFDKVNDMYDECWKLL